MFWIIVGLVILAYVILKAVNSYNQTNVNIANAKIENDYYNSLSSDEKIAYRQQKSQINEPISQQEVATNQGQKTTKQPVVQSNWRSFNEQYDKDKQTRQ
jgi:hypothetical protein